MVNKEEYKEELKKIEARHEIGKAVDGISVKNLIIRTDSEGQTYLIMKTHVSAMPLIYCKVEAGYPPVLVKEDAEAQISKQEREKAILQERIKQEEIQAEVAAKQQRIQAAAEKERQKVTKEAEASVSKKLKKLFGGE